jgi:hypothetical protein
VPHIKKPAIVRQKIKIWSWAPDGRLTPRQTGRLTVGRKLTSTSLPVSNMMCSLAYRTMDKAILSAIQHRQDPSESNYNLIMYKLILSAFKIRIPITGRGIQ